MQRQVADADAAGGQRITRSLHQKENGGVDEELGEQMLVLLLGLADGIELNFVLALEQPHEVDHPKQGSVLGTGGQSHRVVKVYTSLERDSQPSVTVM